MKRILVMSLFMITCSVAFAQSDLTKDRIRARVHVETPILYADSAEAGDLIVSDSVMLTGLSTGASPGKILSISDNGGVYQVPVNAITDTVAPRKYEAELADDAENDIPVPFTISSTTQVMFNGRQLRQSQWSGIGTNILTLLINTRKYDDIILTN